MRAIARDFLVGFLGAALFCAALLGLTARETRTDPYPFGAAMSSRTGAEDCRAAPSPHWCRAAFYSGEAAR